MERLNGYIILCPFCFTFDFNKPW